MTKEQDFKQRFAVLLRDLQQDGTKDAEIMWMLGMLAAELSMELKSTSWSAAKSVITVPVYDQLLKKFQQRGEECLRAGRRNEAYAIQVLSYSLIARTQTGDPDMVQGEKLIDVVIDRAMAVYRQVKQARTT
ncbi:MAG: hypothetical protein JWP99_1039 [Devosia sp.]|nr:hypothetical protein [Devosia sp.]